MSKCKHFCHQQKTPELPSDIINNILTRPLSIIVSLSAWYSKKSKWLLQNRRDWKVSNELYHDTFDECQRLRVGDWDFEIANALNLF